MYDRETAACLQAELRGMTDAFDRLSYLVALAGRVPTPDPELMTDEYLERNCQSPVWLDLTLDGGQIRLRAYSESLLIRGLMYLLLALFDGAPYEAAAKVDPGFFAACGLDPLLSDSRQGSSGNLLRIVLRRIKELGPPPQA